MLLSKPRLQHYSFAHLFLREKAFRNPATTVDELSREGGSQYLKSLWLTTGLSSKDPNDEFIDPDGIECSPFLIGENHRGVIVQFPKPLGPTEVFFAAIVIPFNAERGDKCSCRYFTLELSSDRPDKTILGEWNGSMHSNCGAGPPSVWAYFEETIISLILEMKYDPWKHQHKFEEWVDTANRVLKADDFLTDEDVKAIWKSSKADKESEFLDFLSRLGNRPSRTFGKGTDKEVRKKASGFEIREEPVKWSRELFGGDLLPGERPAIKISRMYIIETLRKPLDVGLAMVLWGAIGSGVIVWLGSPWWTGVVFASMVCMILFVYLSTSRIRQIRKRASLTGLSSDSAGLNDNDFVQSIGRSTEWTTKLNKVIEVIWGLGFLALIPLLWWFFGAFIGIVVTICTLLIAFLFFIFTAKTNIGLFKMAVEQEKADRQSLIDKFKAKSDVG